MALLIDNSYESDGEEKSFLAFSDLRLNCGGETRNNDRPFSSPPDLIDFSFPVPPSSDDTFAADEVFYHGLLLPINISEPPPPVNRVEAEKPTLPHFTHRRAGSLDRWTHRPSGEALKSDHQRLRRASTDPRPTAAACTWQKWPLFVLGSMRFPAEMEMKDIRSRQRRRGSPVSAEDIADNCGQKSRWRILRVLSCKAAENTAISPVPATGRFCP